VIDAKFAGGLFRIFTMAARNRHNARVFTILKAGDLRRARKARPDDANAYCFYVGAQVQSLFNKLFPLNSGNRKSAIGNRKWNVPPQRFEPRTNRL
jgi:hypothetical protein